jgi:hypothetical protein
MFVVGLVAWVGAGIGALLLSRKSDQPVETRPPDGPDYGARTIRWIRLHAWQLFLVLSLVLFGVALLTSGETNCGASCD